MGRVSIRPTMFAAAGAVLAGANGRTTREVFQGTQTGLIWITDGGGGGVTALRYTGPKPGNPLPGAR